MSQESGGPVHDGSNPGSERYPLRRRRSCPVAQGVGHEVQVGGGPAHVHTRGEVLPLVGRGDQRHRGCVGDHQGHGESRRPAAGIGGGHHEDVGPVGDDLAGRVLPVPGEGGRARGHALARRQSPDEGALGPSRADGHGKTQSLGRKDPYGGVVGEAIAVGREDRVRDRNQTQSRQIPRQRQVALGGGGVAGPVAVREFERVRPPGQARHVPGEVFRYPLWHLRKGRLFGADDVQADRLERLPGAIPLSVGTAPQLKPRVF